MKLEWLFDRYVFALVFLVAWIWLGAVADAATYYVAKTGNNSNSCASARNEATPKQTINAGLSCLSGGDTLTIKAGTYPERIIKNVPSGAASSPTTIKAESPRTVILKPSGLGDSIRLDGRAYITFDGLVVDASDVPRVVGGHGRIEWEGPGNNTHHITFQNGEVKNVPGSCFITGGNYNKVLNSSIHHCIGSGDPDYTAGGDAHGFYWAGSNGVIEGNDIHHINGYAIQFYKQGGAANTIIDNVFRNNTVHHNAPGWTGKMGSGSGMSLGGATGNTLISNNVFYNLTNGIGGSGNGNKIYHNTIYNMSRHGIRFSGGNNAVVKNNIIYDTGSTLFVDIGSNTTKTNNLTSDPRFVDATRGDFRLKPESPAIDAGVTLSAVPDDITGLPRPQGASYDIGAHEFRSGGTNPLSLTPPTNMRVVGIGQ